jgi:hypothetical protein
MTKTKHSHKDKHKLALFILTISLFANFWRLHNVYPVSQMVKENSEDSIKVRIKTPLHEDDRRIRCPSCYELYQSPNKLGRRELIEGEQVKECRRCHRPYTDPDAPLWKLALNDATV